MDSEMLFCMLILIGLAIVVIRKTELYRDIKHMIINRENRWK